jgi:hypothetical protein
MNKKTFMALTAITTIVLSVLAINLKTARADTLFDDSFDDGLADGWTTQPNGYWSVSNGAFKVSIDLSGGTIPNAVSTVDGLILTYFTIETQLRFTDSVGFRAGIVFCFTDMKHYYSVVLSDEYDCLDILKFTPQNYAYGENIGEVKFNSNPIQNGKDYLLKVVVSGSNFRIFLDGQELLTGFDSTYSSGAVGLSAKRADASFDYFTISNATLALEPSSTPTPIPIDVSLPSYSDDFSADSGQWQYLGSAYRDQTNQSIVLTTSSVDQTGIAVFRVPVQGSFVANFSYKAGGGNSGLKNDGIVMFFYKQNYSSTVDFTESYGDNGIAGGRLGFNSQTIFPGYGVEFDGWANIASEFDNIVGGQPNPAADPSGGHIALMKDFSGDHLTYVNDQRIADNVWHNVSVQAKGSSMKVYVDQTTSLQWNGTLDRTYSGFGFTGSNGQIGGNWHMIDNFSITVHSLQQPLLTVAGSSELSFSTFKVKISGGVTVNGSGIASAPICLSYSVTNGQSWQDLTYLYTDSSGSYSVTWLPSVTGNYKLKAIYQGGDINLDATTIVDFALVSGEEQSAFSVTSNSTLSALIFDSDSRELSFGVSGETGTTGYVEINIPKSVVGDVSGLTVSLDGNQTEYTARAQGESWFLSFSYNHSSHQVTVSLGAQPVDSPAASIGKANSPSPAVIIAFAAAPFILALGVLAYVKRKRGSGR